MRFYILGTDLCSFSRSDVPCFVNLFNIAFTYLSINGADGSIHNSGFQVHIFIWELAVESHFISNTWNFHEPTVIYLVLGPLVRL